MSFLKLIVLFVRRQSEDVQIYLRYPSVPVWQKQGDSINATALKVLFTVFIYTCVKSTDFTGKSYVLAKLQPSLLIWWIDYANGFSVL